MKKYPYFTFSSPFGVKSFLLLIINGNSHGEVLVSCHVFAMQVLNILQVICATGRFANNCHINVF